MTDEEAGELASYNSIGGYAAFQPGELACCDQTDILKACDLALTSLKKEKG